MSGYFCGQADGRRWSESIRYRFATLFSRSIRNAMDRVADRVANRVANRLADFQLSKLQWTYKVDNLVYPKANNFYQFSRSNLDHFAFCCVLPASCSE